MKKSRLGSFVNSLTGRVALVLTAGMVTASFVSLLLAERARQQDFERFRIEQALVSAADIAQRIDRAPAPTLELVKQNRIFGIRPSLREWNSFKPDPVLGGLLAVRLGDAAHPAVTEIPRNACFPDLDLSLRAAGMGAEQMPNCWNVEFTDQRGIEHKFGVDVEPFRVPPNSTLVPLYLIMIVAASSVLAYFVTRITTAPLRRMTQVARAFSLTADAAPIPETGPSEVRTALETFNLMQQRVREGLRDRTQLLASIAHDLQTPLTRLRLRLEHVTEDGLRSKLIADLNVMQQLVRAGLDLARSSESAEPWAEVDVDSLLSALAEDAAEFGSEVRFTGGCAAHARVKLNALLRCLNNLIENAVKYAGDAELACERAGADLQITVRDHGPGIPEAAVDGAMEPLTRLQAEGRARPGTGIGLTIARAQAQTFGASLSLRNHPEGGLLATIKLPRNSG